MFITGLGQDSHRFEDDASDKPLILGGVVIPGCPGLKGNSDADVVLHALTNAISGLSGVNILGAVSDELCLKQGVTDSKVYLIKSLETLEECRVVHVSLSVEARRPHLSAHIPFIRKSLSSLLSLPVNHIGFTATTGEGLTAFGRGEGIQVFAIATAETN